MTRDEVTAVAGVISAQVEGGTILIHIIEPRAAIPAPPPGDLAPEVLDYLAHLGIDSLYSHQARACRIAMDKGSVILSTATASGKTLAFTLPVLHELAVDPDACALFLYPLKALTNDQLSVFDFAETSSGLQIDAAIYDGDTPRVRRPRIRQMSRVVLSNPYEIHEILPYHHMWRRFFANLKYVVIDEAHRYTGVFGSNVAQVIRRLNRVAAAYGSKPRFILASASTANPGDHAAALTGVPCEVVDNDGSPAGERTLIFCDGSAGGVSGHTRTRDVVAALLRRGIKTLCFTRSRRTAELVASLAGDSGMPVAPYRAGYLPDERRRLERAFRDGDLKGVVSTNALELGIDIGDLDAVVLSGYPGSISGFWQQVGRAGRRGTSSLSVFVAFQDILDRYLLAHPDVLLDRGWERATIDLENEHILAGHMLCAASELPLRIPESDSHPYGIAKSLAAGGLLHETAQGFIYGGNVRPQEAVKLDGIGEKSVALVDSATGDLLENLDYGRALRDAFTGAVYMHQAKTWVVEELNLDTLRATAVRRDVDYYTLAHQERFVEITGQIGSGGRSIGGGAGSAGLGTLKISHRITRFVMKRFDRVIGSAPLDMPQQVMSTTGLWIDFGTSVPAGVVDMLGAIHALEHTMVGIAPLALSCDPDDLAGFSTMMAPHSGAPALFIYDGFEGGIGLSARAFDDMDRLVRTAFDILSRCPCETGCPACCLSPRCGNDNQPMDKVGGAVLAGLLLDS